MPEIKGSMPCPDCSADQDLKFDGRKYYISCTACGTFTSYQSKAARARILERLNAAKPKIEEPEPELKKPPILADKPPRTAKPARTTGGIFDSLDDLF